MCKNLTGMFTTAIFITEKLETISKFKRGLVNLNNRISIQWNTLQPLKNEVIEINLLTQKYVHNMLWKERLYKNLYTNIHKNSQE